jgi:hypothetical protein
VAPLARRQGLGLALGEAEQVRGEARRPGMQRIAVGRRRMAGEVLPLVTRGGGRVTGDEEGLRQEFNGGSGLVSSSR